MATAIRPYFLQAVVADVAAPGRLRHGSVLLLQDDHSDRLVSGRSERTPSADCLYESDVGKSGEWAFDWFRHRLQRRGASRT